MNFPKLSESGRIGKLQLKNRIVTAPMITRYVSDEGNTTERMLDYYGERARGGCAMVIIEASYPRMEGYPGRISLANDRGLQGLKRLVEV